MMTWPTTDNNMHNKKCMLDDPTLQRIKEGTYDG